MASYLERFCSDIFDYSLWIPGDAFRPLSPTPTASDLSEEALKEPAPVDLTEIYAEKVGSTSKTVNFFVASIDCSKRRSEEVQ